MRKNSFAWLAQSRKAQVAAGTVLSILLARLLPKFGFDASTTDQVITALSVLGPVWIGSIAFEDGQQKRAGVQPVDADPNELPPSQPTPGDKP